MAVRVRVVDTDLGLALRPLAGELELRQRHSGQIIGRALVEILGGHPVKQLAHELLAGGRRLVPKSLGDPADHRVDQVELTVARAHCHLRTFLSIR